MSIPGMGIGVLALRVLYAGEEAAEDGRVGVAEDGRLESIDGFAMPAHLHQYQSELILAEEGSRVGVRCLPELPDGLLEPACRRQCQAELEVAERRPRANGHRRLIV